MTLSINTQKVPLAARAVGGPTTLDLVRTLYKFGIMAPEAISEHLGISYHDAMLHVASVKIEMQGTWILTLPLIESSREAYYKAFVHLHNQKYTMGYVCTALKISGLDYFQFLCRKQNEKEVKA